MDPQHGDNKIFTITKPPMNRQMSQPEDRISPTDKRIMIVVLSLTILALITMTTVYAIHHSKK